MLWIEDESTGSTGFLLVAVRGSAWPLVRLVAAHSFAIELRHAETGIDIFPD